MDLRPIVTQETKDFIIQKYPELKITFEKHIHPFSFGSFVEYLIINDIRSTVIISTELVDDLIYYFKNNKEDVLLELKAAISYEIERYLKTLVE